MTSACTLPTATPTDASASVTTPPWQKKALWLAAGYNIVWGGLAVLFPLVFFRIMGMVPPNYPELWQCIGMIVGVYGVGYAIAATNPQRHWPIVLVGLMGKILGPIGFAWALIQGRFPLAFGLNILTNDLIWWVPFFLILRSVYQAWLVEADVRPPDPVAALATTTDTNGQTLHDLSKRHPLLLVFVRHAGCTFCRETLADLAKALPNLRQAGLAPVVVHMGSAEAGTAMLAEFGLTSLGQVSDPDRSLYRAIGLKRGTLTQLLGRQSWVRGWEAGIKQGHGVGALQGDGFQLSGYAIVDRGKWRMIHAHANASETTPFVEIASRWTKEATA